MALVSLNFQSKKYFPVYACEEVGICLDLATWGPKTVSGAPVVKATLKNGGRYLGSAGGYILPPWENPRGEEHYQYSLTYDDTQITDPVTDVIGCADIESLIDGCVANMLIDLYTP